MGPPALCHITGEIAGMDKDERPVWNILDMECLPAPGFPPGQGVGAGRDTGQICPVIPPRQFQAGAGEIKTRDTKDSLSTLVRPAAPGDKNI